MSTLFGKRRKRAASSVIDVPPKSKAEIAEQATTSGNGYTYDDPTSSCIFSFQDTGLMQPLVDNCLTLGLRKPTAIQKFLIPFLLKNRTDPVVALAATGTGKTAAFLLPILHHLSSDPYPLFAVIMTPTRELAKQIHQQVLALGAPYAIKSVLFMGGIPTPTSYKAHIAVCTPGRLGTLLRTAIAPRLQLTRYLILDEADRLLSPETDFEKDMAEIVLNCGPNTQTVLLSATMTASLRTLQDIVGTEKTLRTFVAPEMKEETTKQQQSSTLVENGGGQQEKDTQQDSQQRPKIPAGLVQEYLFMPDKVRDAYLLACIRILVVNGGRVDEEEEGAKKNKHRHKKRRHAAPPPPQPSIADTHKARSAIVFCATCERTALVAAMLDQVGVPNVALHSVLSQDRRLAALGKFRNHHVRILVATDICARGLDLEHVELVLNASVPRNPVQYVHRVGRTARAGRRGRAVTLVSEREVDLVHAAETLAGRKMTRCTQVTDAVAIPLLGTAAKALRLAKLKLQDIGFDELLAKFKERKVRDRKERQRRNKALEKMALEE